VRKNYILPSASDKSKTISRTDAPKIACGEGERTLKCGFLDSRLRGNDREDRFGVKIC
jgi:hypothetical protein